MKMEFFNEERQFMIVIERTGRLIPLMTFENEDAAMKALRLMTGTLQSIDQYLINEDDDNISSVLNYLTNNMKLIMVIA